VPMCDPFHRWKYFIVCFASFVSLGIFVLKILIDEIKTLF
jgi:hypothetical protein